MEERIQEPQAQPPKRHQKLRFVFPLIALVVLGFTVAVIWRMTDRLQQLERQLRSAEQRAASADDRMLQYADEMRRSRQAADEARRQVSETERGAEKAAAARRAAELEAERMRLESEMARDQAERARQMTEQARARTEEALGELDLIRKRREAELNRMQEALARVAPTRRTPSGMVVELSDDALRFDFDKAELRPENRELLSRIAGVLLASEGYHLFIDGHTDDVGTDEYNRNLSMRRATSVRDYLVQAGIPEQITTIQGFGKSNPLVKETTPEARAKNRRVEIGIVDTIIHYEKVVDSSGRSRPKP